ncbi:MAG: 2-(1,2-epoxy-1,2-dihydrophenyl)acetyl-CoA isomerase [Nitrososphaerota archaeon]
MSAAYSLLLYEREGGIAKITLNRPERLNALNEPLLKELNQALRQASEDREVRCIVLTGAGRGFCVGADIQELRQKYERGEAVSLGQNLRLLFSPLIERIRRAEKPVLALINGPCAGAGLSMALACDVRIASEEARFVIAFTRIGLVPDSGASLLLPLHLGLARSTHLIFTSGQLSAREALELGLVARVVPPEALAQEGMDYARQLASGPTKALAYTKRLLNAAIMPQLAQLFELEAHYQELASRTEDHAEGLRAFFEKREPRFKGS